MGNGVNGARTGSNLQNIARRRYYRAAEVTGHLL